METPAPIKAEYAEPPCARTMLETRDVGGAWPGAAAYTNATKTLTLGGGAAGGPPGAPGSSGDVPELLDGDGDVVPTRWAEVHGFCWGADGGAGGPGVRAPPGMRSGAASELQGGGGVPAPTRWTEGRAMHRRPPASAHSAAANELANRFLPLDVAVAVARSLRLAGENMRQGHSQGGVRPANVPSGFAGGRRWRLTKLNALQGRGRLLIGRPRLAELGAVNTGRNARKSMKVERLPFGEALTVARSLGLRSQIEYNEWSKAGMRPRNMPSNPPKVYKGSGWEGWGHWLGTGTKYNGVRPLPFEEALAVARSLQLGSMTAWKAWCKTGVRPANVPSNPQKTYKAGGYMGGGWQGWGHWLGTGNTRSTSSWLPFGEALGVARSLELASEKEWQAWVSARSASQRFCSTEDARRANVPSHPEVTYAHCGWQGWEHWLGGGDIKADAEQFRADLGPPAAPAAAPAAQKRAAPGRTQTTPGQSGAKRQRR